MDDFDAWPLRQKDELALDSVRCGDAELRRGARVRLAPCGGADAFDLVLKGKTATIASIEQDFEGRIYLAVTVDEDPGKDLGELRQPGHRFFFALDEVDPLETTWSGG